MCLEGGGGGEVGHVRLMGHFQVAVSLGFEVSLGAQLL